MKTQLWAIAIAMPLILAGCDGKEASGAGGDPPPMKDLPPTAVVSTVQEYDPAISPEKTELHRFLEAQAQAQEKKGGKFAAAKLTGSAWDDAVGHDLPLQYVRCKVPPGQPPVDCHLHVDELGTNKPGNPARWLRFEKNDDGSMWAEIRSDATPKERMTCETLTVNTSFLSGWCEVRPHANSGRHWFEFLVLLSDSGKRESVYFGYYDTKPSANGEDVHNGEGHGGSD